MRIIALFIFLTPFVTKAQFSIKANITGLADGTVITLHANDPNSEPAAKATTVAGKFEMKGKVEDPNIYVLNYAAGSKRYVLFLDNSNVTITGTADGFDKLVVKGSPSQDDFTTFQKELSPMYQKLSAVAQEINNGKQDAATRAVYENTLKAVQAKTDQFVNSKPGSYVSPFVILIATQLNTDPLITEARYNKLNPAVQKSGYGKMLATNIAESKIGAIGTEAINFVQNDPEGNPVSLTSFRGKYVLIDFWASWCKPCRAENPAVVKAYNQFKDKNFTVLGVSLDRTKDAWVKAIQDDKLPWTQVSDLKFWSNEVAQKYKIESIPQNFLLDPKGKIIAKDLRGEALIAKLKEVLN
jgi:peroxiredoxin